MIHCYAMLPYFRESKEDFDEIAQILAKQFVIRLWVQAGISVTFV